MVNESFPQNKNDIIQQDAQALSGETATDSISTQQEPERRFTAQGFDANDTQVVSLDQSLPRADFLSADFTIEDARAANIRQYGNGLPDRNDPDRPKAEKIDVNAIRERMGLAALNGQPDPAQQAAEIGQVSSDVAKAAARATPSKLVSLLGEKNPGMLLNKDR